MKRLKLKIYVNYFSHILTIIITTVCLFSPDQTNASISRGTGTIIIGIEDNTSFRSSDFDNNTSNSLYISL